MSDDITPGRSRGESLWLATTERTSYDALDGGLDVDVAVVGGGITGLSTAVNLKEAGRTVAVVERDRILEGVTAHTTAKLTSLHGLIYEKLVSEFGSEKARQYAAANEAAIEEVARRVERDDIECEFQRRRAYTYTESPGKVAQIRAEADAAKRLDLPASVVESTPLPFDIEAAIRFDDQAEFHPRKYLLAIAQQVHGDGSYIFEETSAMGLDPGAPCAVETERGEIVADDVVVATHFPFFDRAGYFSRMHPHQAYLLAVRTEETPPEGMYYSTASPAETIRNGATDGSGEELLLVGGQSHKPGHSEVPTSERYERCEEFAHERFSVESVEHRWSTMDYTPVDEVPYIGQIDPLSENVYVGTGFSGWGMTGGTAAGMILSDLIVDGESPWADVFDPQRFTPQSSARDFITENASVGGSFVGDWVKALLSAEDVPLSTDEAKVTRYDGRPMGLYRDEDGTVHAVSAVCPHMNCLLRWNDAERTWDCPCHGSRFTCDGDVISGPALEELPYQRL